MSTGSRERGLQLPTIAPKTPITQRTVSQASLLNSPPLDQDTPTQNGQATNTLVKFVGPLLSDDLEDHQLARFENVLKYLLWRASTKPTDLPPEDLSADDFCATLLTDALNQVTPLCNAKASPTIFTNMDAYLSQRTERDRCSAFAIAANDALEKLEHLNIQGLKRAPEEAERILFLANHQNEIQIQSGKAASHPKRHIAIVRLDDAAGAYPSSLLMEEGGQLMNTAPAVVKPRSVSRILSCIEFKALQFDLKMIDCLKNDAPLLDDMDPMQLIVDGPAIRAAEKAAEKEGQEESWATHATLSGSESQERPHEPVDAGNNTAKRVGVDSGSSTSWYSRAAEESPMALVALPKQTTRSDSQMSMPQEKTSETKTLDPTLQAAIETLSMSRVHACNIIIIDERVHILYYDRQGGTQSYGLNILKSLPHFLVLLLAFQRLDLEGWGFAPNLRFDTDNHTSAQLEVTLCKSAGGLGALVRQPAASVKFMRDRALRVHWELVGRATGVYECDLAHGPPKEQVFKLTWTKVSHTPDSGILEEPGEATKGHILDLLAPQIPTMMNTRLLCTLPRPHFSEPLGPRRLVFNVCRMLFPVWDLTPDGFFDVWVQTLFCHMILWKNGLHHRDISPGNMMYYYGENGVVGVLNDRYLPTGIPSSGTPNVDRTGTIPFMALQLLSGEHVAPLFRHDAESFIWVFIWVCGCSDGLKEVLVAPYKGWKKLDMLDCRKKKGVYISGANSQTISVSDHHSRSKLICGYLAWFLRELPWASYGWQDMRTSEGRNSQEQKCMATMKVLIPKIREAPAELHRIFSPEGWDGVRFPIRIHGVLFDIFVPVFQQVL